MRHKYQTRAIVLSRAPLGEVSAQITLLTPELGLLRARAQSVRRSGAKLAASLATFAESELLLVRGVENWRVAGAALSHNWFPRLSPAARTRAARVAGLLLRLTAAEAEEPELFFLFRRFLDALAHQSEEEADAAETLAVLRLLRLLGLDAGAAPPEGAHDRAALALLGERGAVIARINRGLLESGL